MPDSSNKIVSGGCNSTTDLDGFEINRIRVAFSGWSGDIGMVMVAGGVSPAEGYWGGGRQVAFEFTVAEVGALRAEVRIAYSG